MTTIQRHKISSLIPSLTGSLFDGKLTSPRHKRRRRAQASSQARGISLPGAARLALPSGLDGPGASIHRAREWNRSTRRRRFVLRPRLRPASSPPPLRPPPRPAALAAAPSAHQPPPAHPRPSLTSPAPRPRPGPGPAAGAHHPGRRHGAPPRRPPTHHRPPPVDSSPHHLLF